jgi:hypothetical protein
MNSGCDHTPLQALHAAHGWSDHGQDMGEAEMLHEQAVLRGDHVADLELGELHARLGAAVARRRGQAVADRIGTDDEIPVGIERLARADHEIQTMVIAADGGDHQNGVGFVGVELAVRHIGNGKVLDHLAAFQREVARAVELVRRLLG